MHFICKKLGEGEAEVVVWVQAAYLVLKEEALTLTHSFGEPLPPDTTHSVSSCGESKGMWHACRLHP